MPVHDSSTTVPLKACSRCGIAKALTEFVRRGREDDRLRSRCNDCRNSTALLRYHNAKAAGAPYSRSPWEIKAISINKRGGRQCGSALRLGLGEPTACYVCGDVIAWATAAIDHVVPVSRGGSHEIDNLRWACRRCNSMKSDMTLDELVALARKLIGLHDARA